MGSENTLNNRALNRRQAIKRQFRAPTEITNEQSDVVKELAQRPDSGFTEEQLLRLLAETTKRVAQSYGIKV